MKKTDKPQLAARRRLFERLRKSERVVVGDWTREELYDKQSSDKSLDKLLDGISPDNIHSESDTS